MGQLRRIVPELLNKWRSKPAEPKAICDEDAGDEEFSTRKIVQGVTDALAMPHLQWWIEFLHMFCTAVGEEASWQEGCRCHGDQHVSSSAAGSSVTPFPKRRRTVQGNQVHTVADRCPWKGRRSVENVLGRIHRTKARLIGARSAALQKLFARMVPAERARLIRSPLQVAKWIAEELEFKLAFYQEYHWLILEVLAPLWGGTVEQLFMMSVLGPAEFPVGSLSSLMVTLISEKNWSPTATATSHCSSSHVCWKSSSLTPLHRRRRETWSLCMERSLL